jgi:hypothetical protein
MTMRGVFWSCLGFVGVGLVYLFVIGFLNR